MDGTKNLNLNHLATCDFRPNGCPTADTLSQGFFFTQNTSCSDINAFFNNIFQFL